MTMTMAMGLKTFFFFFVLSLYLVEGQAGRKLGVVQVTMRV